jgi:hypothetical protein
MEHTNSKENRSFQRKMLAERKEFFRTLKIRAKEKIKRYII